jgi:single-stranded DNA-specific DHH superfamily exonuclease
MKLISGNKKYFFNFLERLTEKDNIGVYCHNDLDGISSAVIINKFLEEKKLKYKEFNFIQIGKDTFKIINQEINKKRFNKIILCDLSIDVDLNNFNRINKKTECLFIDHHPSKKINKNIIRAESKNCCAFVLYSLLKDKTNLKKYEQLIAATIISEMTYPYEGSFKFIKKIFPKISKEKIFESIPGKLSKKITSCLIYFDKKEKKVFNYLLKGKWEILNGYEEVIDKEVLKWEKEYKKNQEFFSEEKLHFYYGKPKFGVTSIVTTRLCLEKPDETFVFVTDSRDKKGILKISCRNNKGTRDVNLLMKKAIKGLKNASGGGHLKASGGQIMKKDLNRFKENLINILKEEDKKTLNN